MANEKQFGIKEVMQVTIADFTSGIPISFIPYAEETTVMTDADRLDLRGGAGNYLLTSWDHTKKMSMKISVPLVDLKLLAHLSGKDLATGVATAHKDEILVADATNKITLSATPVTGTLKIYLIAGEYDISTAQTAGTPAGTPNAYSITGTSVTLNATTAPVGTRFIALYDYSTTATANTITVLADAFTDFVRVTGQGLWRNIVTGDDEVVSFDFKKAKFKPNFTLTQKSTDATKLELEADIYYTIDSSNQKIYANIVKA